MTEIEDAPGARVLVGIDISQHRHEVLIAAPCKQRRRKMTLTNAKADFDRLVTVLLGYGLPVRIGFEATGNYHRALVYHLSCRGVRAQAHLLGRTGPDAGGAAQQLGQERPEGRAGDPAHASDRRRPALP